jgi:hypothetical protein
MPFGAISLAILLRKDSSTAGPQVNAPRIGVSISYSANSPLARNLDAPVTYQLEDFSGIVELHLAAGDAVPLYTPASRLEVGKRSLCIL